MNQATATCEPGRTLTRADYERYMPMVRRIAMRLVRRLPRSIQVGDLISAGWVGLLEASSRAHAGMSEDEVMAYVSHRVRGAMLDYLRQLDPATRYARNASRRVARVIRERTQALGRPPSEDEIAAGLGVDIDEYREILGTVASAGMTRLEMVDFEDLESSRFDHDSEWNESPDMAAEKRLLADAVAEGIGKLPDRLQQVVALYYQHGCTLREIGAVLQVTESRASQLHAEAMHRLRAVIGRA
jgi:RNA polymerase sigma factor for flagellar operon FliA